MDRYGPWFQYACFWIIPRNFSFQFHPISMEFVSSYHPQNIGMENKHVFDKKTYTNQLVPSQIQSFFDTYFLCKTPIFSASIWFNLFGKKTLETMWIQYWSNDFIEFKQSKEIRKIDFFCFVWVSKPIIESLPAVLPQKHMQTNFKFNFQLMVME